MKTTMRILALALVCAFCLSAAALAENGKITVTGTAQVSVATDHAVIRLGVSTKADTPSEAQAENKKLMENVMKALREKCSIPDDKIATSSFSIYTASEWSEDTGRERQYYQVMHHLSVTVDNIDQAGSVIDACVEAGANIIDYVSFESSGMREAYDKALQEAVADAKRKAELMAAAAGLKLGGIVSMTTVNTASEIYNNTFRMAEESADTGAATKLSPGTQSTSANVSVTWELVP